MAQANTERLGGVKLTGRRRKMDEISVNGNHDRGPITGSQSVVYTLSLYPRSLLCLAFYEDA